MSLIDECVTVLGEHAVVLSKQETKVLFQHFFQSVPFTFWGRIDWNQVEQHISIASESEIIPALIRSGRTEPDSVFILWDEASLPAVKSTLQAVLDHLEDVTVVSFDTWLVNFEEKYVIEFYHEGEITIGFIK